MSKKRYTILYIITLISFIGFEYYTMTSITDMGDSSIRSFSKLVVEVIACLLIMFNGIRGGLYFWMFWMLWAFVSCAVLGTEVGVSKYVSLYFPQAAFFVGYYCHMRNVDVFKWLTPVSLILIGISTYFMFNNQAIIAIDVEMRSADNIIFYIICAAPFVLMFKNFTLKCVSLAVIIFMTVFSLKRTALLMIGVIVLIFIYDFIKIQTKAKIKYLFILVIITAYGYNYMTDNASGSINRIIDRFESLSEDQGSGRVRLWNDMRNALSRNYFPDWIFGHGNKSTMQVAHHTSGHNDVLTLLLEQGIIGLSFYLIFIFNVIKLTLKLWNSKSPYRAAAGSILTIVIFMGSFSNLVPHATYFAYITFAYGIILGQPRYGNKMIR